MTWNKLVQKLEQLDEALSLPTVPSVYSPLNRPTTVEVNPEINVQLQKQQQPPTPNVSAPTPPVTTQSQKTTALQPAITPLNTADSDDYVDFIKSKEGFTPSASWDYAQHSVGYGTRGKPGETITQSEADVRLRQELKQHEQRVDKLAAQYNMPLNKYQRGALISYDFNTGRVDNIFKRTGGDPNNISSAIRGGIKTAQGKFLKGLENRRNAEADFASRAP